MNEGSSQVVPVSPQDVQDYWQHVREFLRPAIDRSNGRWRLEYVLAALVQGHQFLWVACDSEGQLIGAFTTEFIYYPEKKMLTIHFLGGNNLDSWYWEMSKALKEYGRSNGCDAIEVNARSGLWKWFKEDKFSNTSVFYERPL